MKVGTRIYIGLIISGLVITLASFLAFTSVKDVLIGVETNHEASLDSVHHMKSNLIEAIEESYAYMVSGDIKQKNEFLQSAERFDQAAERFANVAKLTEPEEEAERVLYEKIVSEKDQLIQLAHLVFKEYEKQGSVSLHTFNEYENLVEKIKKKLNKLQAIEQKEVHNAQFSAHEANLNASNSFYGIGFLAILMALGLGLWVSRTIVNPLKELGQGVLKIGDRQFDTRIKSTRRDEIGLLTESFNKMAEKLKETTATKEEADVANKAKSDFLSHMTHEIRTPLNAILGYAQILQMNGSLNSRQREAVNTIETSGNHLLEIVNRILDITKIEAGLNELKLKDFNLTNVIGGLSVMFRERCEAKQLKFTLEGLDTEPVYVNGDEGKLRQILVNLLGNAIKFTERGKVVLKIERTEGHKYIFKVRDTGVGISSEDKVKIFQSFMQAEAGLHFGGTGLGLTITKELVELMGGKLLVESELGEGSCFTISLELPPAKKTVPPRSERNRKAIRLSDQHSVKALVVEDIEENRRLLSEVLRTAGIETQVAENGKEALERLKEFAPQIIFMDRIMPVMNGDAAVKAILNKYGPDRFKLVAITASAFDHQRENSKTLGYDDYILKPFRIAQIHHCIERLLDVEFEYEDEKLESQKI